MHVQRNTEARSRKHICLGQAINIKYFECAYSCLSYVAVKRMRRVLLPSVACPAVPYLTTLSHNRHGFKGKVFQHKMCILFLSAFFSETFLILRRN
jgi:hypothetical protein